LCLVYDAADPDEWEGLATCRRVSADFPISGSSERN
jgi:hypothetical protein